MPQLSAAAKHRYSEQKRTKRRYAHIAAFTKNAITRYAIRSRRLLDINRARYRLEEELRQLEERKDTIHRLLAATEKVSFTLPNGRKTRKYRPKGCGHPLPFPSLDTASDPQNYAGSLSYEPSGYGSDPECWKKRDAWTVGRKSAPCPVPHIDHDGNRRYYVSRHIRNPELDTNQELDLDADTIQRHRRFQ
jgi:hypothetical protein